MKLFPKIVVIALKSRRKMSLRKKCRNWMKCNSFPQKTSHNLKRNFCSRPKLFFPKHTRTLYLTQFPILVPLWTDVRSGFGLMKKIDIHIWILIAIRYFIISRIRFRILSRSGPDHKILICMQSETDSDLDSKTPHKFVILTQVAVRRGCKWSYWPVVLPLFSWEFWDGFQSNFA